MTDATPNLKFVFNKVNEQEELMPVSCLGSVVSCAHNDFIKITVVQSVQEIFIYSRRKGGWIVCRVWWSLRFLINSGLGSG